jgi:hypothetical protein
MREVRLGDFDERTMDKFLAAMEGVSNILYCIEKRRKNREVKTEKLKI